jgi:hypothetical protein
VGNTRRAKRKRKRKKWDAPPCYICSWRKIFIEQCSDAVPSSVDGDEMEVK